MDEYVGARLGAPFAGNRASICCIWERSANVLSAEAIVDSQEPIQITHCRTWSTGDPQGGRLNCCIGFRRVSSAGVLRASPIAMRSWSLLDTIASFDGSHGHPSRRYFRVPSVLPQSIACAPTRCHRSNNHHIITSSINKQVKGRTYGNNRIWVNSTNYCVYYCSAHFLLSNLSSVPPKSSKPLSKYVPFRNYK